MPESLVIDPEMVEGDDYPVSVTLRYLPRSDSEPSLSGDNGMMDIPNGLHRSNLTADTTDALLQNAQDAQRTSTEKLMAKYVVGCDGAHSWTRRQIGSVMEGDYTDLVWLVYSKLTSHQVDLLTGSLGVSSTSFLSQTSVSLS